VTGVSASVSWRGQACEGGCSVVISGRSLEHVDVSFASSLERAFAYEDSLEKLYHYVHDLYMLT